MVTKCDDCDDCDDCDAGLIGVLNGTICGRLLAVLLVGRWGKSGVDGGVSVNANVCKCECVCG